MLTKEDLEKKLEMSRNGLDWYKEQLEDTKWGLYERLLLTKQCDQERGWMMCLQSLLLECEEK